jgi:hypothetical protein
MVPSGISDYAGANRLAFIPRVYDLTHERLVEISSQFSLFYKAQLKSWRSNNAAATDAALCTAVEMDKLKRMSGSDPRAGFDTAVNWMVSPDADTQLKAARNFGDSEDRTSQRELQVLSRDRNQMVADSARGVLKYGVERLQ